MHACLLVTSLSRTFATLLGIFLGSPFLLVCLVQQLRRTVHEVVGRINGHYGSLTHVPIHHLDRQLSFNELCALYAITDVLLVTSLRDGMNLVSYEYVACQVDNAGKVLPSHSLSI